MQYIDCWRTANSENLLVLQPVVTDIFEEYAQRDPALPESGGILLGYVRGPHLDVIEATRPTASDQRFLSFFNRSPDGHRVIAERRWLESEGFVRYLGEWHTHPQDYPAPSYIDKKGWQKIAQKRADKRPLLAIIVGRKDLHVELIDGNEALLLYPAE